ncbi:MAG: PfaD family polyunsaturated fatty acid/polyketide biosynthesis protein [Chloroflexi bacterium]|nr:PfaD family polyunsaturated fatty acid/polyketide biosynthesis protein [Chloroflexota bacterium]
MEKIAYDEAGDRAALSRLDSPVFALLHGGRIGLSSEGELGPTGDGPAQLLAAAHPLPYQQLGDPTFRSQYGLQAAYGAGAMANGIASVAMVIELGKAGLLGSFGAAGLVPVRLEEAILAIQAALPQGPYAFNLIHSPHEDALEKRAVDLYLKHQVRTVEASAFLDLTPHIVRYRAAGLESAPDGSVRIHNRVIVKLSRREVAQHFMKPAPEAILNALVTAGAISEVQAGLARRVPVADDVTVEADSGGHTDNRPLVGLLPSIIALRDEIQALYHYDQPVRVGAAGGISTPASALGALMMGAAYLFTGSVNQAAIEAGSSPYTKTILAKAGMADVMMAPSADMFEMGVKVQVLKTGTLFPMRAQKLYDTYMRYNAIDEIPSDERQKLESQIFKRSLDSVWEDTVKFFSERDPAQIERANQHPKRKMALIFRWYLGLSSRWSNTGEPGREMDYQIWCGPSMGSFNDWVQGTYLQAPENRRVVDIALQLLTGCSYLYRLQALKLQGVVLPTSLDQYRPEKPLIEPHP